MVKKQSTTAKTVEKIPPQSIRLGIFGASGTGKSYRARELTKGLTRIVYFDPLGDFAAGATLISGYDKLRQELIRNWASGFKISYCPAFGDEEKELSKLCMLLVLLQYGYGFNHFAKVTLVVDELDLSFPTGICQRDKKNGFAYLCRRGRHFGINLIGCSQRTAQVDVCFRGNLTGIYLFRHVDPIDTEKAIAMLGRQYAADFKNLNDREYIYKSGAAQKIVKK